MANGLETTMDYEAVENVAKGFDTAADVCKAVETALQAAIAAISASLIGNIVAAPQKRWLQGIRKAVSELRAELRELSGDLRVSIKEHQQAEEEAASRFAG
ncbi:MAG: hypothetical protein ACLFWD_06220 [Anaerolineales bacterium]